MNDIQSQIDTKKMTTPEDNSKLNFLCISKFAEENGEKNGKDFSLSFLSQDKIDFTMLINRLDEVAQDELSSVMHDAARQGRTDVVKAGMSIDIECFNILKIGASAGHLEIVKLGLEIDDYDIDEAIGDAIENHHYIVANFLQKVKYKETKKDMDFVYNQAKEKMERQYIQDKEKMEQQYIQDKEKIAQLLPKKLND